MKRNGWAAPSLGVTDGVGVIVAVGSGVGEMLWDGDGDGGTGVGVGVTPLSEVGVGVGVTLVHAAPQLGCGNVHAFANASKLIGLVGICSTHHEDKSWLNAPARWNIESMLVTLLTSQSPISELNDVAFINISSMFVTPGGAVGGTVSKFVDCSWNVSWLK